MIPPREFQLRLPVIVSNNTQSTTDLVGRMLMASYTGNLKEVRLLVEECPDLVYAQYNYTPPIHFAVREGHTALVKYLLDRGAYDPEYKTYPFLDSLATIAKDRNHFELVHLLEGYANNPSRQRYEGDNGKIEYLRSGPGRDFQRAVEAGDLEKTRSVLAKHPEFAEDETFFSGEGILMMPAKAANHEMLELLLDHGATVPQFLKWAQFYYLKHYDTAEFLLSRGMSVNLRSWHHVTMLHDMAHRGEVGKARLLIEHGAELNRVEEEYQSTPLGLAARWGKVEMIRLLLSKGADPNKSGASWSKPLAWARSKGHTEIEALLTEAGAA